MVQNTPKINEHRNANAEYSENAIDLGCPCARHEYTCRNKPPPPNGSELPVAKLAETDVRVNRCRHEEDEDRVEENETRLRDVCVICKRFSYGMI
jgi:hypothetical protein